MTGGYHLTQIDSKLSGCKYKSFSSIKQGCIIKLFKIINKSLQNRISPVVIK
jgi:hypothetical protein